MSVRQTLLDIGLNMFGMELFAESLLKNEKVREHVRARSEPLTVSFPVRRSDCPGWAGVYITLWPVKEGETYPPPSEGIASVAASDEASEPEPAWKVGQRVALEGVTGTIGSIDLEKQWAWVARPDARFAGRQHSGWVAFERLEQYRAALAAAQPVQKEQKS